MQVCTISSGLAETRRASRQDPSLSASCSVLRACGVAHSLLGRKAPIVLCHAASRNSSLPPAAQRRSVNAAQAVLLARKRVPRRHAHKAFVTTVLVRSQLWGVCVAHSIDDVTDVLAPPATARCFYHSRRFRPTKSSHYKSRTAPRAVEPAVRCGDEPLVVRGHLAVAAELARLAAAEGLERERRGRERATRPQRRAVPRALLLAARARRAVARRGRVPLSHVHRGRLGWDACDVPADRALCERRRCRVSNATPTRLRKSGVYERTSLGGLGRLALAATFCCTRLKRPVLPRARSWRRSLVRLVTRCSTVAVAAADGARRVLVAGSPLLLGVPCCWVAGNPLLLGVPMGRLRQVVRPPNTPDPSSG